MYIGQFKQGFSADTTQESIYFSLDAFGVNYFYAHATSLIYVNRMVSSSSR